MPQSRIGSAHPTQRMQTAGRSRRVSCLQNLQKKRSLGAAASRIRFQRSPQQPPAREVMKTRSSSPTRIDSNGLRSKTRPPKHGTSQRGSRKQIPLCGSLFAKRSGRCRDILRKVSCGYQEKFKRILSQQFPVIFIDEYQDTHRQFMESITDNFLRPATGPLVGLFGDHWQTIYRSEYELAQYPIEEIAKGSNFRSMPAIVDVLNNLRPELQQAVHDPEAKGEARFFHTNSYCGDRTSDRHSKGDLPPDLARKNREALTQRLQAEGWNMSKTKVLMLTHNVLAAEQGYPSRCPRSSAELPRSAVPGLELDCSWTVFL